MNTLYVSKRRKEALVELKKLCGSPANLLIVHYSCESFYDNKAGKTPRITSIAVRFFNNATTKSFSIHKVAEISKKTTIVDETEYDLFERNMLDEFFEFLKVYHHFNWIHWNMRDVNYGFDAIENRYRVLGGSPVGIPLSNRFDLARMLKDIYGAKYIEQPHMEKLVIKNNISMKDFLSGKEEAECFLRKEYIKMHQSTLRKVHILFTIIDLIMRDELKTNATFASKSQVQISV